MPRQVGLLHHVRMVSRPEAAHPLHKELLADQINFPRKVGKLPGKCVKESYKLEYGEDTMEVKRVFMMTKMMCLLFMMLLPMIVRRFATGAPFALSMHCSY